MRRIVADVAPRYVFAENVVRRAIDRAADDLEAMGYETRAVALSAADLGADHLRRRYWLLAHAHGDRELPSPSMQKWPNCREFVRVFGTPSPTNHEWLMGWPIGWTALEPLATGRFHAWLRRHSAC